MTNIPQAAEAPSSVSYSAPEASRSALAQVWRFLSHPALLIILLILAAVALAAHLSLPQLPTALAADPAASSAWLDKMASGRWGGQVFRALGMFDLAHDIALRALLPLLATVLLVHLVDDVLLALAVRKLAAPIAYLPGLHAWDASLPQSPDEEDWFRACADVCQAGRIKVTTLADGGEQRLCDCHAKWQWPPLLTEIGLLLALAALLLNLYNGWQMDDLTLDPGGSVALAPYSDLTAAFSADASQLSLCCPQKSAPLARGAIADKGTRVQVADSGSALHVALKRGDAALKLQGIEQGAHAAADLVVHFPEARSERAIAAPAANLFFRLVALDDGGFRVQALDAANQVLFSREIHEAATLPVGDDLTLILTPTTFVTLSARGRPWTWLLWPALLLTLLGLLWRWRRPYWRLGALANEAGAAMRWQGSKATRKRFAALLHQLEADERGSMTE